VNDNFNPEALRLPADVAAKLAAGSAKKLAGQSKRPRRELFLQVPHKALVAGSKVLGGKRLLVWLYIHHRIWADKATTVAVGNKTLGEWGVSRKMKYTALRRLEDAGLVSISWRKRLSPLVTISSR
jgi:hypothetical protein